MAINRAQLAKELEPELRDLMGYSQGGYVLGFFTDPTDTEGKFESVSSYSKASTVQVIILAPLIRHSIC